MTDAAPTKRAAWLEGLVAVSATAYFVVAAAMVMFSAFMFYDDEGYVLNSLRNFAAHGGLYGEVYTQYGPFPFAGYAALNALGLPLTHTSGRLISLGAWTATAIAAAALTAFVTRQLGLRLLVLAGVFGYLWIMANEPSHPGGIIVLLTALLATAGYRWLVVGRHGRWAVAVGVVTAALLLTKINIGVFVAFSAVTWWCLHGNNDRLRRFALPVTIVWSAALPYALMRPLLAATWVQTYALVFACAAVAMVVAIGTGATGRVGWRPLVTGLLTAAGVAGVILAAVIARGTTPRDLLEGLLLGPLRQPVNFSLGYAWPAGIELIAVLSLAACIVAWWFRRKHRRAVDTCVSVLRVLLALALAVTLARLPEIRPEYVTFGFALPCLWLFAWPLDGEAPASSAARAWVSLLLLGQCLHVFPVPGSQIAWGSVLLLPLAAIGAWEGATWLARQSPGAWIASRGCARAVLVLVASLCAVTAWNFGRLASRYRDGENLRLPGAELIRLPAYSTALLRVVTLNASAHADLLFSLPGMFSLNLWTDLPTPTRANVTHWFSLLNPAQQQAIVDALEAHPRACVVIDRGHVEFLAKRNLAPRGLLYDYIARTFEPVFRIDDIEFCVRRGRTIQPLLLGELLTRSAAAAAASAESSLLRLTTLLPPGTKVARIEVSTPTGPLVLQAGNARVEAVPANIRGEPIGPARTLAWPLAPDGMNILSIFYPGETLPTPGGGATITLRDEAGNEVALARVRL